MHFTAASSALLSIASLAAAAPLRTRDTCHPNFQGSSVLISTSHLSAQDALFLNPAHSPSFVGDNVEVRGASVYPFQPQFNGSPANDYIIKLGGVSDNSLLLAYINGAPQVGAVQPAGSPSWTITCDSCASPGKPYASGDDVAKSCSIVDTATGYSLDGVAWDFTAA